MLWPQANAFFFETLELTLFTEVGEKKTASWIGMIAAILKEASSLQTTPADGTSIQTKTRNYTSRWYSSSPAVQEWNGQDCLNSQDLTESSSKKKSNTIRRESPTYHSSLSRVLLNKQNSRTPYDLWKNNNYGGWKNKLDRASIRILCTVQPIVVQIIYCRAGDNIWYSLSLQQNEEFISVQQIHC